MVRYRLVWIRMGSYGKLWPVVAARGANAQLWIDLDACAPLRTVMDWYKQLWILIDSYALL